MSDKTCTASGEWTDEALRIAIAQTCGWKLKKSGSGFALIQPNGETNCADSDPLTNWHSFLNRLPHYPSDLNACHEMEKVLTKEQESCYIKNIENGIPRPFKGSWSWAMLHATAREKCLAFVKTLGLKPKT